MQRAPAMGEQPAASSSADNTDKPLLGLIKRLVSIDNTEPNTTVENSLLKDILSKEFDMSMETLTELQNDIYMNVLKKFLKSWPRWDEFDKLMKASTADPAAKAELMIEEYAKLRHYLKKTLAYTSTQLDSIMDKIQMRKSKHTVPNVSANEPGAAATVTPTVVMEVSCSRDQLNQLFYWKPHPNSLTIFNITEEPSSSKISIGGYQLREILNWPHVTISVSLPNFEFVRKNSSHFERMLINKKLPESHNMKYPPLSSELYYKNPSKRTCNFRKNVLVSYLVQVGKYLEDLSDMGSERKQQLLDLFNALKSDLLMLISYGSVGCEYQYFLAKYPYVRRLCTKEFKPHEDTVASEKITEKLKESINPNDFDLHLEEVICPAITFQVTKFWVAFKEDKAGRVFDINYSAFTDSSSSWLKIECNWCGVKFEGYLNIYTVVTHFSEHHCSEPDWQCTKCEKSFTMNYLAANRWLHDC